MIQAEEESSSKEEDNNSESEDLSDREIEDINEDLQSLWETKAKQKIEFRNDLKGMQQKLEEIRLKLPTHDVVPWTETLVTLGKSLVIKDVENDLEREKLFYSTSLDAANEGLDSLREENVPYTRPEDYFAEMIKTDAHMSKVKSVLLKEKREIEEAQQRTKNRIQKKISKQIQTDIQKQRKKERKEDQQAIKKWQKRRKGNLEDSDFPDELLNKDSALRKKLASSTKPEKTQKGKSQRMTNTQRKAMRYGMGGKKRGMKRNTTDSANDISDWNSAKNRSPKFSPNKTKKKSKQQANRPGKRKRQQGWSNSGGKRVKRQKK